MFVENTTLDNNVVNFSLNVTKFGMLISILKMTIYMILVAMESILTGNYEFLSYQNVHIYKMAWRSVNTIGRALNHISLERAGPQHSDKMGSV